MSLLPSLLGRIKAAMNASEIHLESAPMLVCDFKFANSDQLKCLSCSQTGNLNDLDQFRSYSPENSVCASWLQEKRRENEDHLVNKYIHCIVYNALYIRYNSILSFPNEILLFVLLNDYVFL